MKRTVVAIASAIVMIAFSVTLGGAAWSATTAPAGHPSGSMGSSGPCGCSTTTTTTPPPTTTTTTTPPPTTTTTAPPTTTTTLPVPPPISGTSTQPPTPAATVTPPVTTSLAAPTELPFTGRNIKPFLVTGVILVIVGLALLTPSEYWRRGSRRLSKFLPKRLGWLSGTWMMRSSLSVRLRGAPSMVGCSFFGL